MDFPQYRKLNNDRVLYRIVNLREFDELQRIGDRILHYHFLVDKYPEIIRIQEMIDCSIEGILPSTATEFDDAFNKLAK